MKDPDPSRPEEMSGGLYHGRLSLPQCEAVELLMKMCKGHGMSMSTTRLCCAFLLHGGQTFIREWRFLSFPVKRRLRTMGTVFIPFGQPSRNACIFLFRLAEGSAPGNNPNIAGRGWSTDSAGLPSASCKSREQPDRSFLIWHWKTQRSF